MKTIVKTIVKTTLCTAAILTLAYLLRTNDWQFFYCLQTELARGISSWQHWAKL
ncbi:MAG: hypothetical protein JNL70_00975 [Saprospiraceae bacterium]|nr:hypothetical protein [Saprospiraceae bacterium]